ncbi:sulfurtransferase TusA family protein [Magnetovibrio sp.]|uniref:sulfurtransferase TusA family protein n=1 Tax=Magnetovibrio sp. TaxID=2024836 RepID=UPI002F9391F8
MNSIPLDAVSGTSTLIDAKGSECPIPILKLKSALKKAADHSVFGVMTTDSFAEPNVRDYCKSSGNEYLGVENFDGYDIHYVKKRTVECQRCSNMRTVTLGIAAIATLAYTAPQVIHSSPSGIVTVVFAVALASLPPVLINNLRLLKSVIKKAGSSSRMEAAQ